MRDPRNILIAFVLPVVLLFLYGYAINLDVDMVRIGVLRLDDGAAAASFEAAAAGHAYLRDPPRPVAGPAGCRMAAAARCAAWW